MEYVNHPLLKENKLLKRKYQLSIFARTSQSNCLVVIPTGLGKTIIALLLAIQRLKDENSKIIFLAPTRPLVDQHYRTFLELTKFEEEALLMMTGSQTPEKRVDLYNNDLTKCIFMTPQILQNDIIAQRISLKNISLLIFDEAHRATGDYAYTFLAKKYIQAATSPKILAMTASPGKNREKIQEVMQNLFLDAIEIRNESDPDVKPYIQEVETIWKNVDLPQEMIEVLTNFEEMLKKILQELKKNELLESEDLTKISRKDLLFAGKNLDQLISKSNNSGDFPRLLFCKKLLANAIRISHMSELLEAQGLNALKAYLDKNIEDLSNGKGGKSLQELFSSVQMSSIIKLVDQLIHGNVDHPKMATLMAVLLEQFTDNPDSRILIFGHFRDTVKNIVQEINKNNQIKAHIFVGQQKKGKEKGLSQKEQLEILTKFKQGEYNILVATSVAEEGLDISECDVVIFYDVVPSEIRAIQRRGRTGRNRSGKVILLKTTGTREEGYFWAEKHREKQMKKILTEMKNEMPQNVGIKPPKGQKDLSSFMEKKKEQQIPTQENTQINSDTVLVPDEEVEVIPESNFDDGSIPVNSQSPFIIVDSRETASSVTRELSERNVNISLQKIPIGDYILSERCGIERKAIPDFTSSIKDGRLFSELQKLRTQFSIPILIIEGDINTAVTINRAALLGTIASLLLKMNIYLYQTHSSEETAEILIALAKKEQEETSSKPFSIRFKKAPEKIPAQLEYIIAGIPGINATRAQDLLTQFRTLQNLFNASEEEIKKTPNIGPVIAKSIKKYSNADYLKDGQPHDTN